MIYKGVKILEQRVRYEIWDDDECIQSNRPEFVAYLVEDADDGLMYEELDEAKEAIDSASQKRLAKPSN